MKKPKEKGKVYFVGHQGIMKSLNVGCSDTKYILDANLVLSLLQSFSKNQRLSGSKKHFLSVSRQSVSRCWHQNKRWIPVDPVLALMELTRQHQIRDYQSYYTMYKELMDGIYGIKDTDPAWVSSCYEYAFNAQASTQPSIAATIQKIYQICPPVDKPTDSEILDACEEFFRWIEAKHANLSLIGGPLLHVCVYAICGSPQARAFIKYSKRSVTTAHNVAWDVLYWIMLETEYHRGIYTNSVACTCDLPLAEFLAFQVNNGQRGQLYSSDNPEFIEMSGNIHPPKLKRLEGTKLEKELSDMLFALWAKLQTLETDSIKVRFNPLDTM